MKHMKKLVTLLLALIMALALGGSRFGVHCG